MYDTYLLTYQCVTDEQTDGLAKTTSRSECIA